MKPDAKLHNQDPEYMRELVESSGLSPARLGEKIGHDERTIRRWCSGERSFTYTAQFTVECVVLMP